jgi:hypothetical protein
MTFLQWNLYLIPDGIQVPNDTNNDLDVFVRDRETQQTVRVSVDSNGSQLVGRSGVSAISSDGRFVAFPTTGANPPEGKAPPALLH